MSKTDDEREDKKSRLGGRSEKTHKTHESRDSKKSKKSKKSKDSKKSKKSDKSDKKKDKKHERKKSKERTGAAAGFDLEHTMRVVEEVDGTKSRRDKQKKKDSAIARAYEDTRPVIDDYFGIKTKWRTREKMHEFCDDVEIGADLLMVAALKNKGMEARILMQRSKILARLWQLREDADCDDEVTPEEFHEDMRILAVVRRKLIGLDSRVSNLMNGGEESSSDTEGDGEKGEIDKLKFARQNLRYALGQGSVPQA